MRATYDGMDLKVNFDELRNKALEAMRDIRAYRSAYEELAGVIRATEGYWEGPAATEARNEYARLTQVLDRDLADLEGYPRELLETAAAYEHLEVDIQRIVDEVSNFTVILNAMPSFDDIQ